MTHSRYALLALSLLACALSSCAAESPACAESGDCTGAGDASILLQKGTQVLSQEDPTQDALKKEQNIVDAVGKDLEQLSSQLDSDTTGKEELADVDAALTTLKKIETEEQDDGTALEEHSEEEEEPMSNECQACVDNTWSNVKGMKSIVALPTFEQCKADCTSPECRHGCRKSAEAAALELFNRACPVCNSNLLLNHLQDSVPEEHVELDEDAVEIASLLTEVDGAEDEDANAHPFSSLTSACASCVKGTWQDAKVAGGDIFKACTDGQGKHAYCQKEAHKGGRKFLDEKCASHCHHQASGAESSTEKDLDNEEDKAEGPDFLEEDGEMMDFLEEINDDAENPDDEQGAEQALADEQAEEEQAPAAEKEEEQAPADMD